MNPAPADREKSTNIATAALPRTLGRVGIPDGSHHARIHVIEMVAVKGPVPGIVSGKSDGDGR
jgi:hypothetical protein